MAEPATIAPMTPPPGPPPVVHTPPVKTLPFEDGYAVGNPLGSEKAVRRDKVPPASEIVPLAEASAAEHPDRGEKWKNGFVQGYLDGFSEKATGKK